jgi:hypothetical protein
MPELATTAELLAMEQETELRASFEILTPTPHYSARRHVGVGHVGRYDGGEARVAPALK